ncbi:MAG: glutathione peroxidase [Flavobacteriales bacterium]
MKALISILSLAVLVSAGDPKKFYDYSAIDIDGNSVNFSQYEGKVVMIVNVASKCGFTPQYTDLQELYLTKKDEGFVILGFPSNDFMKQEPGTNAEIKEFCSSKYEVTFPMFEKISVKGKEMHPLYQFLTQEKLNGVKDSEVKWNFQKYLIDKHGKLREIYPSAKSCIDPEPIVLIDELLAEK